MKFWIGAILVLCCVGTISAQMSFADSCFLSATVSTSFPNSSELTNNNADLMSWNTSTSSWDGSWPAADLTMPPPDSLAGCRSIFMGNGETWTTGGEGVGMLLNQPIVAGQTYSFSVTYVSNGFGSDGAFSPTVYTSSSTIVPSGTLVGNLTPAGYTWLTSTFSFTATAAQNGDTWLILFTGPTGTSGIVNSFCPSCQASANHCLLSVNLGRDTSICVGEQLSLNAQNPGATYLWSNSATTQQLTVSGAGTYSVLVTQNSCTARDTIIISSSPQPVVSMDDTAVCTAPVNLNAGNVGSTYLWSNNATTQAINVNSTGTYSVIVTNNYGCTTADTVSVSISPSNSHLTLTPGATPTTCGLNNGVASITATGTTVHSYQWSNGGTLASINNLPGGTYNITVTDTSACSITSSVFVDTSSAVTIIAYGGRAGCTSSGTANVNINSGTGPFTYLWSNNGTTSSINSLSAGNYTVTVTGAAGCSASTTVTVISTGTGVTLTSSSTPSQCSSSTGSMNVNAITGDSPFTYNWSNGGTAATISNVAGGSYTVTVTANGGCSATASVTVTASGSLSLTTSANGTTCGNSNGSASVNAGNGSYTYAWSNNATTDTINNLSSGTYTVTVLGSAGCTGTASATVNPSGSNIAIQAQSNAICLGDTSQICAPADYHIYHWSNGAVTQCVDATQSGSFEVTVTDNANCTATSNQVSITVNIPDTVNIALSLNADTIKAGAASTYQWYFNGAPIAGATLSYYIPLQNGNYYVVTTGVNGCPAPSNMAIVSNILGITELSVGSNIKVYPNPLANGNWHLDVSSDWIGSNCEIYDAAGKQVFKAEIKNTNSEFELNVAQGVYVMRINAEQRNYAIKLVKF